MALTIQDVAKEAGVSATTVSKVLNNRARDAGIRSDTEDRILKTIQELGYHRTGSARGLRTRRSHTIGFALYSLKYLREGNFAITASGVGNVVGSRDYSLLFCTTAVDDGRHYFLKKAAERKVDGIVIQDEVVAESELRQLETLGVPFVLIDREIAGGFGSCVVVDNAGATYEAAMHLVREGYRHIAFVHSKGNEGFYAYMGKIDGYRRALLEAGPAVTGDFIAVFPDQSIVHLLDEKFVRGTDDCPTGLVCYDDSLAVDVINGLGELGVAVPEQVSVIGCYNDRRGEVVRPRLTTINFPHEQLGEQAAEVLFEMIDGRQPRRVVLEAPLLIRESCRCGNGTQNLAGNRGQSALVG